jgi:hypothetical protein
VRRWPVLATCLQVAEVVINSPLGNPGCTCDGPGGESGIPQFPDELLPLIACQPREVPGQLAGSVGAA